MQNTVDKEHINYISDVNHPDYRIVGISWHKLMMGGESEPYGEKNAYVWLGSLSPYMVFT